MIDIKAVGKAENSCKVTLRAEKLNCVDVLNKSGIDFALLHDYLKLN